MAAKKRARSGARRPEPPASRVVQIPRWIDAAVLLAIGATLVSMTWRKWPDLLVDFGQQLYIPWRLASGEHLYSDIAFLHGPLSQHFHALWFRLIGPSFTVLIVLNLAVLAAIVALIYAFVDRVTDRLTAMTASLVFLLMFGLSQYTGTGNYNYAAPYVHEATHGMALAAALLLLFQRYLTTGTRPPLVGAGLCLGACLLTKVDVAAAAAATAAVGFAGRLWIARRENDRRAWIDVALFSGAAIAPAVLFFVGFLTYLPAASAIKAVGGAFFPVSPEVARNAFYLATLGFEDVAGNAWKMITAFLIVAAFVAATIGVGAVLARPRRRPGALEVGLAAAIFAGLAVAPDLVPWRDLPRALPLTSLAILAGFVWLSLRSTDEPATRSAYVPMAMWSVFALALLSKMVLHARVELYGFYLAMPAMLVLVVALTYWLPRWLDGRRGSGVVVRALTLGAVAAMMLYHFNWSQAVYAQKTYAVGKDGDAIVTYGPSVFPPTAVTDEALRWIDANMPPDATFVALPEGISLNYLSRRPTTVPVINFMMTEMIIFGEDAMTSALARRPPDYVLLVDKDTSEFGVGAFGVDPRYGQRIMAWVTSHYDRVTIIGSQPFRGRGFGIEILKRR
jgi:hypothetical protein